MTILKLTASALAILPFSAQAQSTTETEDAVEDDGGCCSFYSERLPSRDLIVVTATGTLLRVAVP